ncbi:MAG: WbqC family protein [Bacteroidales bacterium]
MPEVKKILLSIAYLGPVEYFASIAKADEVIVEKQEHYIKQTYRNRCLIATTNGMQALTIPVVKVNGNRTQVKDIQIAYFEKWQMNHWRTIESAYSHAPYFLFYQDAIFPFYQKKFKFLFDFNHELLDLILDFIRIVIPISFTDKYQLPVNDGVLDLRNAFSPKKKTGLSFPRYIQVFEEKYGFLENLSILDLLFNEGPGAMAYLLSLSSTN